jgi:hypothetical protein
MTAGGPIVLAEADVEGARFRILRPVEHRFDPFSSRGRSRHAGFVFHRKVKKALRAPDIGPECPMNTAI